jgi:hypothetical protein
VQISYARLKHITPELKRASKFSWHHCKTCWLKRIGLRENSGGGHGAWKESSFSLVFHKVVLQSTDLVLDIACHREAFFARQKNYFHFSFFWFFWGLFSRYRNFWRILGVALVRKSTKPDKNFWRILGDRKISLLKRYFNFFTKEWIAEWIIGTSERYWPLEEIYKLFWHQDHIKLKSSLLSIVLPQSNFWRSRSEVGSDVFDDYVDDCVMVCHCVDVAMYRWFVLREELLHFWRLFVSDVVDVLMVLMCWQSCWWPLVCWCATTMLVTVLMCWWLMLCVEDLCWCVNVMCWSIHYW